MHSATSDLWLVSSNGKGDVRHRLQPPESVRIGRSSTNELILPDPAVSREHAVLDWIPDDTGTSGEWRVMDRGSSSGTRVNGVPLRVLQSLRLEPGDRVEVGPVALEFVQRCEETGSSTIHTMADHMTAESVESVQPTPLTAEQLTAVLDASHQIHAAGSEEAIFKSAVEVLAKATGFQDVAFVRPSPDGADLRVLAATGKAGERRLSRTVVRRARGGPVIITDSRASDVTMVGTLVGLDSSRIICVPVSVGDDFFGLLYLTDRTIRGASVEMLAALAQSIGQVAALALSNQLRTRMARRLEEEQRAMFDGTLHALIASIDAKDPYTRGHSARVADYAELLARAAGLPAAECERARLCGLVHDIGKIGVSEAVLRKADQLTEEEFKHIAAHPVIGYEILRGIPQMTDVLPGVLEHHERYDGRGYPNGTQGESISRLGRLVCIADSLDAMTTNRTYRTARSLEDALAEIQRCSGSQFDPALCKALAKVDIRELRRVVGAHVMNGVGFPEPPELARPFTELKAG